MKCNDVRLAGATQNFVFVALGNSGSRPLSVNPLYLTAATSQGVVYQPGFIPIEQLANLRSASGYGALQLLALDEGQIAYGWLVFETPHGTTFDTLTYDNRLGDRETVSFGGQYCK